MSAATRSASPTQASESTLFVSGPPSARMCTLIPSVQAAAFGARGQTAQCRTAQSAYVAIDRVSAPLIGNGRIQPSCNTDTQRHALLGRPHGIGTMHPSCIQGLLASYGPRPSSVSQSSAHGVSSAFGGPATCGRRRAAQGVAGPPSHPPQHPSLAPRHHEGSGPGRHRRRGVHPGPGGARPLGGRSPGWLSQPRHRHARGAPDPLRAPREGNGQGLHGGVDARVAQIGRFRLGFHGRSSASWTRTASARSGSPADSKQRAASGRTPRRWCPVVAWGPGVARPSLTTDPARRPGLPSDPPCSGGPMRERADASRHTPRRSRRRGRPAWPRRCGYRRAAGRGGSGPRGRRSRRGVPGTPP